MFLIILHLVASTVLSVARHDVWSFDIYTQLLQLLQFLIILQLLASSVAPEDVWSLGIFTQLLQML